MQIKNNLKKHFAFFLFISLLLKTISASEINVSLVPQIKSFSRGDLIFKALQESSMENDKRYFARKETFPEFFSYVCSKNDTLIKIASSSGIPYDTISTLNSIAEVSSPLEDKKILIPSVKGVFIPENPENSVEILLYKEFQDSLNDYPSFVVEGRKFFFLEGKRFSPYQRLFFLDSAYSLPLETKTITSEFGMRESPVYGKWKQHNGIDFLASVGDKVFACRSGIVSFVKKNDSIFGNYVIISHPDGITSVYAHLSKIFVSESQSVKGREVIGEAGESGMATGPHLHFEIRKNGKALDPKKILPS